MKEQSNQLNEIVTELVDNLELNWQKANSLNDDEQLLVKHLNTINQVAQLHRIHQHTSKADNSNQSPIHDEALFKWGRLSIIEKIGEGAFGEVYRAYDDLLDRQVALKLLKTDSKSSLQSDHFIEEAKRLAKVRHTNVLAIHGANIHDKKAGFWADLIHGKPLNEVLQSKTFEYQELLKTTRQVAQGLDAIHNAGIIHGDIKPANIIQDERGDYLIMDFGAGLKLTELKSLSSYIHGTPALMAPELFSQQHEGTATDIYAMGATLFKLTTGRYPVKGDDLLAIQQAHENQDYLSIIEFRSDLPKDFRLLIESMIQPRADQRPDTQTIIRKLYELETAPQRRRNKIAIWAIVSLLIIGVTVSTFGFYRASHAKNEALTAQNKSETINIFLQDMLKASAELGGGRNVKVADILDQSSEKLITNPPEDKVVALELHLSLAHSYNALGIRDKSLVHAKRGMDLAKQSHQPIEETYVRSQLELIDALENNTEHQKSIDLAKNIISDAGPFMGDDHWYIQLARKYIITNLFSLSKYDEGMVILNKYFKQVPDPKTASNNLGFEILHARTNALSAKGRFEETIQSAHEAIEWLEAYPRKSLLNMRSAKTAFGVAQMEHGLIDEGVKTIEEVLVLAEQIYGKENQEYVDALVNLGAAQRLQNNPDLAKQTTLQAYDLAKKIYGDEKNLITVGIGTNLANMLVDLGDTHQGEIVMRESLEMAYQVLGVDKPQSLILEYNLAELLNNQGKFSEALEYAISTHSKKMATFGKNHPYVFLSLDNWAISLRGLSRIDAAVKKHKQATDGIIAALGSSKHQYALLVRQHQMDTLITAYKQLINKADLEQLVNDLIEVLGLKDPATQRYKQVLDSL